MLQLVGYRHYPDVFADRREQRYLTEREAGELEGLVAPAIRSRWLLIRLAAKGLVQHYLSDEQELWIPENSLDVTGALPEERICLRLRVTPDGPYGDRISRPMVVRAAFDGSMVFCAAEPSRTGKRFAVALQPIDTGFPFFLDEPLSEQEVLRLADVEEERRNAQVAACVAVKRAVLGALTLERAGVDGTEIVVGATEPGQPVELGIPSDLVGRNLVFCWTDITPGYACAYAAVLGPDFAPEKSATLDLEWLNDPHDKSRR